MRIASVKEPRDWPARWRAAGGQFYGNGRMAALKDDPIWRRISAFGEPTPPFDYGSQMGLSDIDAGEAVELGLITKEDAQAAIASFGEEKTRAAAGSPDEGDAEQSAGEKRQGKETETGQEDPLAPEARGEPMSFEEADGKKANPEYETNPAAQTNCYSCPIANEARRRGWEVEAILDGSLDEDTTLSASSISATGNRAVIDIFIPKAAETIFGITNPEEIFHATREEVSAAGFGKDLAPGRYFVSYWKRDAGGHNITFEKLPSGKIRFYDPQSGKIWWDKFPEECAETFALPMEIRHPVTYFRIDNKPFTELAKKFVRKSPRTK